MRMTRLKALRLEMGLSQYAISDLSGISRARYQLIEQCLVEPTASELASLNILLEKLETSIQAELRGAK